MNLPNTLPTGDKIIPIRRSFSRWNQYVNRCPRQYAINVILNEWKDTPAFLLGKQVHSHLEAILLERQTGKATGPVLPDGPLDPDTLLGYSERCCSLFDSWEKIVKVEAWINDVYGLTCSGKIDVQAIDDVGDPHIFDFKTCGTLTYIKDAYEAKNSLQLWMYCGATNIPKASFVYLAPNSQPRVVTATFNPEELERHRTWIHWMDKIILDNWVRAGGELGVDRWGAPVVQFPKGYADLTAFALAPSEMRWCSKRFCDTWSQCFGAKN